MLYLVLLNFICNHFVTVNLKSIYISTNTIQSLGLIVVLTLLHFMHVILAISSHLGRTLTTKSTSCEKDFCGCKPSETETFWINLVAIGLLIVKVFLKHIIVFIHIFFIQLFLSLLTLYWSDIRFSHHSKITLCTTREFFLIESIKICDDLNNENQ